MLACNNYESRIRKGTPVTMPIVAINHSKELWGEDAMEFRWVVEFVVAVAAHRHCGRCMLNHFPFSAGPSAGKIFQIPSHTSQVYGDT